jgi:hypothetical protein
MKSNQVATADVVMAYISASGISLGRWFNRLEALLPPSECLPTAFIMAHCDGRAWTSHYYRYSHFYPVLGLMRSLGDPYLKKYDETKGKELIKAFHSFNTMRRSARSIASKKRPQTIRMAAPAEVLADGGSTAAPLTCLRPILNDRSRIGCVSPSLHSSFTGQGGIVWKWIAWKGKWKVCYLGVYVWV